MAWKLEFFEDENGRQPAREWLMSLAPGKRNIALAAIEVYLGNLGLDVCRTEHGKQLGQGLFEFRIRAAGGVLLRVFCHAYGDKVVLLLGGYDKGTQSAARRQSREIETARGRLREFKLREQRLRAGRQRRGADDR
jgi:phage-related protein